jgi:manganese/zinc/iron transport system substrate-binding protein
LGNNLLAIQEKSLFEGSVLGGAVMVSSIVRRLKSHVRIAACVGTLGAVVSLGACEKQTPSKPQQTAGSAQKLTVVATTGMIADVAREVAGDRAQVSALMGEGVDPHLYKASPSDMRQLAEADIILYNGLHLEGRMADVIVKMASRTTVVQATDTIPESKLRQPPEFEGHFDPHAWFDVSLWQLVTTRTRDALSQKDPAGKDAYASNAERYNAVLADLHNYAHAALATVPKQNRVMVTAHDAFGYFGAAYNIEVLGIQGISTDSEASLQDINALVDTLVARNVPAVFIESSVPRKTVDALIEGCKAKGHVVTIGGELLSDAMGKSGALEGTYVGMVLHNVQTVTKALGGTLPAEVPPALQAYLAAFASSHGAASTEAQNAPTKGAR